LSPESARESGIVAAVQTAADLVSIAAGFLAALCIVALTFLVLAEIFVALVARIVPSMPPSIHIGWEYSAYLMGASFLLGAGMTLRAGLQIRVEMLLRAGHGRYARAFETVASIIGAIVTVFLAVTMVTYTLRTWRFGEVSQDTGTPLWIPQAVLAVGAVVLALQLTTRVLACLTGRTLDRPGLGAATAIE
jgi:TRAP-type mannitol/chloroaromatic compound transport system permease small subunit